MYYTNTTALDSTHLDCTLFKLHSPTPIENSTQFVWQTLLYPHTYTPFTSTALEVTLLTSTQLDPNTKILFISTPPYYSFREFNLTLSNSTMPSQLYWTKLTSTTSCLLSSTQLNPTLKFVISYTITALLDSTHLNCTWPYSTTTAQLTSTVPTQLYSTITTQLTSTPLTQLDSTITTQLISTLLDSTKTAQLYH